MIKGSDVERYYKHHLSDYDVWEQKNHAAAWVLLEGNIGEQLSKELAKFPPEEIKNRLHTYFTKKFDLGA